jgi:hypothetical protein
MPGSRKHRRMAAQCLAVARQTCDPGVRASLVEMAQDGSIWQSAVNTTNGTNPSAFAPLRRRSAKSFEPYTSCHTLCRTDFSPF